MASGDDDKATMNARSAAATAGHNADAGSAAAAKPRDSRQRETNVGQALRGVYQQTVNEDVPDEMLKLLGKLI